MISLDVPYGRTKRGSVDASHVVSPLLCGDERSSKYVASNKAFDTADGPIKALPLSSRQQDLK